MSTITRNTAPSLLTADRLHYALQREAEWVHGGLRTLTLREAALAGGRIARLRLAMEAARALPARHRAITAGRR